MQLGQFSHLVSPRATYPRACGPESDCTQWLDTKPHGSVLYVSFGSYAHTSKHEISEIANGLLLSGVNFIWVLRPDIVSSDESDFLPVGFEESVKGRGRIVSWCCQIAVISHPAIGGFLTHCGWNSILESIWCSVPLLCYPLLTDQFTNRKLIVDDLRVGINLCDDKNSVNRKEVSENINRLMKANASSEIREQVKKVKKSIRGWNGEKWIICKKFHAVD
ncbi:UDP-glycosyltransferase 86A1 [Abeliophyllum distichum]|uniref:UDP-glycosyltransferase 86A1 n=1 Tax=Abeliophyllum distichum TaxID=126358 RepID=A0ABD1RGC3_9LAMI